MESSTLKPSVIRCCCHRHRRIATSTHTHHTHTHTYNTGPDNRTSTSFRCQAHFQPRPCVRLHQVVPSEPQKIHTRPILSAHLSPGIHRYPPCLFYFLRFGSHPPPLSPKETRTRHPGQSVFLARGALLDRHAPAKPMSPNLATNALHRGLLSSPSPRSFVLDFCLLRRRDPRTP